jgi:hypothetical protein
MSNVVSAIDGTLHEIQIPSNEPQQNILSANQLYYRIVFYRVRLAMNEVQTHNLSGDRQRLHR